MICDIKDVECVCYVFVLSYLVNTMVDCKGSVSDPSV